MAVGLPPTAGAREIVDAFAAARGRPLVPPAVLATGPCKENILTGDSIDLMRLAAPLLHDGDGGRYLNTFGMICCETPDKSWRSWSIARIMVVDGHRMAGIIATNQHVGMVRKLRTTKVISDCLDPEHLRGKLPRRSSFAHIFPAELQAKVLADWSSYGYPAATAKVPA